MYSAMRGGPLNKRGRGPAAPQYQPLQETAKYVADILYERAKDLKDALAPDHPHDTVEMDPYDQWNILEAVAASFSPGYWDDPDALEDLYKLRKQFQGYEDPELKILAKVAKEKQRMTPDLSVTPENPDYERQMRRIGAA